MIVLMPKDYPRNLPASYERSKLSETQRRWGAPMGGLVRRMLPQILPGVPASAHMGFASNASENEDVGLKPNHAPFHEIGYYGIEGGPYQLPAPNTDTSQPNSWFRLHADSRVRRLLGRDATMTPWATRNVGQASAWADIPLDDQIAIGIVNVADALTSITNLLPASIAPRDRASLWATALSFMAWSAGAAGAARHIRRYERQLAAVPESQRWLAFVRAVAADTSIGAGSTHASPAYSANRTNQKIRVGRGLERAIGGQNLAWYGEVDERAEDAIARRASSTSVPLSTPPSTPTQLPAGDFENDNDIQSFETPSTLPSAPVMIISAVVILGVTALVARQISMKPRSNPGRRSEKGRRGR